MRIKAGRTQMEVAKYLGVTAGAVSQWESGLTIPRASKLTRLANYYGCSVDDLLRVDG